MLRRVHPAFAALSAGYFASVGLFNLYAPLWFQQVWAIGPVGLGVMAAVPGLTRMGVPYLWGWLADRSGERVRLIRIACTLTLVVALLLLVPPEVPRQLGLTGQRPDALFWLAAVTALIFLSNGGIMSLGDAVVSQIVSRDSGIDARAYGRIRVWGSIGFLVCVLLSGAWFERAGLGSFPLAFLAVLALTGLFSRWAPLQHDAAAQGPGADEPVPPIGPVLARPVVRWALGGIALTVLAHMALYGFLSLYLSSHGHGPAVIGWAWGVSVIVEIGWFVWQRSDIGRHAHRWLVIAAVVAALRFGITAWAGEHLIVLMLVQASHALTFAAQHTASVALIQTHFPGRLRARGQALYSALGYGVPGVIGSLGGGWIGHHYGYSAIFWVASGCALLGALFGGRAWALSRS